MLARQRLDRAAGTGTNPCQRRWGLCDLQMRRQGWEKLSQHRILHLRGRQDQADRCLFRRHLSKRHLRPPAKKLNWSINVSLTLHFHPLASYCHKVLIALYENDTPFTPNIVNLGDKGERTALLALWPIGKFPVLRDDARDQTIPESTVIIEYLDRHYPGRTRFIPADADLALQARLRDRFYDLYVHEPMQKIVGDLLRPQGKKDPHGVEEAKARLRTSYGMIDSEMAKRTWAIGDIF